MPAPAKKPETVHSGMHTYTSSEASNFSMGQAGFDILPGATGGTGILHIAGSGQDLLSPPTFYYPEVKFWVALKAIHGADSSMICKTMIGDDFMTHPNITFDEVSGTSSAYNLDLQFDDTINGAFTTVRICDAVSYIKAYRG